MTPDLTFSHPGRRKGPRSPRWNLPTGEAGNGRFGCPMRFLRIFLWKNVPTCRKTVFVYVCMYMYVYMICVCVCICTYRWVHAVRVCFCLCVRVCMSLFFAFGPVPVSVSASLSVPVSVCACIWVEVSQIYIICIFIHSQCIHPAHAFAIDGSPNSNLIPTLVWSLQRNRLVTHTSQNNAGVGIPRRWGMTSGCPGDWGHVNVPRFQHVHSK